MANVVKVPTAIRNLNYEVLEQLGMKLNYHMPLKDFRTLAGKMKYTYEGVKNLERQQNPTAALLIQWSQSRAKVGEEKTVTDLIEMLSQMGRDDAVDLMTQHEFTEVAIPPPNGKRYKPPPPSGLSPFGEYTQDVVSIAPQSQPPAGYGWIVDGLAKEHEEDQGGNSYSPHTIVSGYQHSVYRNYFSPPADPLPQVPRHPATAESTNGARHEEAAAPAEPRTGQTSNHRNSHRTPGRSKKEKQKQSPNSTCTAEDTELNKVCDWLKWGWVRRDESAQPVNITGNRRNEVLRPADVAGPRHGSGRAEAAPSPVIRPVVTAKVALVIGNKEYECDKLKGLFYPEQDAQDVADALWKLGFMVVSLVNLTLTEMRTAVLSFCRLLGRGVYGVLYYAGHGYEDSGENFLLPIDANLHYKREDSLKAQEILQTMQECDTELNLLIIDSCRIRLPEKNGEVAYTKRGVRGNNIFAYSCCSQQEAFEEPDQRNGLYAHHLLRHIQKDTRIELILMDVARDVALTNRRLNQRPCHESDAVLECRLTDPIQANVLPNEYRERVELWTKAHTIPQTKRVLERDGLTVDFHFKASFSNVLQVLVTVVNNNAFQLCDFVMDLQVQSPVKSQVKLLSNTEVPACGGVCKQVVRLSALQKLLGPISSTLKLYYSVEDRMFDIEETISLGLPLVASVFALWDWWITCGRLPGIKCTQV